MAEKKLSFWFYFGCPYSFLAWESLKKTIDISEWKIDLLGIDLPEAANSLLFKDWNFSTLRWERMVLRADILRVKLNRPKFPAPSFAPFLKALKKYSGPERVKFLDFGFKLIFQNSSFNGDFQKVTDFLKSEGLEEKVFFEAQSDPETQNSVASDREKWLSEKIQILPKLKYIEEMYGGLMDQKGLENFLLSLPI